MTEYITVEPTPDSDLSVSTGPAIPVEEFSRAQRPEDANVDAANPEDESDDDSKDDAKDEKKDAAKAPAKAPAKSEAKSTTTAGKSDTNKK